MGQIDGQPVGHALLQGIANSRTAAHVPDGWKVKIVKPDVHGFVGDPARLPGSEGGSRAVPLNENDARGGGGSLSICYWNSNVYNTPRGARPNYIGLAHELVHCWHYLDGIAQRNPDTEEEYTVGLNAFAAEAICENTIRAEHGVAVRDEY